LLVALREWVELFPGAAVLKEAMEVLPELAELAELADPDPPDLATTAVLGVCFLHLRLGSLVAEPESMSQAFHLQF
jgi:hypothetical protein